MNFLVKKLLDFKPIVLDEKAELETSLYEDFKNLLNRIGKSEQKAAQMMELLKDEVVSSLSKNEAIIDELKEGRVKLEQQLKTLERALLDYMDILDNMKLAAEKLNNKELSDFVQAIIKAKDQINSRVGIQIIPCEGAEIDSEVHYVVETILTDIQGMDNTVKKVIENGYKWGNRLLRKASVTGFRYKESNK